AADHVREGIRVNCVSPGTVNTPWINRLLAAAEDPAAERAALEARQPHGRLVEAVEVAEAVAYLAGPRNASTAGVTLAVDGGMDALRVRPQCPPRLPPRPWPPRRAPASRARPILSRRPPRHQAPR